MSCKIGTFGMCLWEKAGTCLARRWSIARGSTSTRATSGTLWFEARVSRKKWQTPSRMISSRARRRWKHLGCCCFIAVSGRSAGTGGRKILVVDGRRTYTHWPNEERSRQRCVCWESVHDWGEASVVLETHLRDGNPFSRNSWEHL